jgi:hypothetical protein
MGDYRWPGCTWRSRPPSGPVRWPRGTQLFLCAMYQRLRDGQQVRAGPPVTNCGDIGLFT